MPRAAELTVVKRELAEVKDLLHRVLERLDEKAEAEDEPLTVERAAELAGIAKKTMYEKITPRNGDDPEIASYKRGRRRYIRRSELNRWLTTYRRSSGEDLMSRAA